MSATVHSTRNRTDNNMKSKDDFGFEKKRSTPKKSNNNGIGSQFQDPASIPGSGPGSGPGSVLEDSGVIDWDLVPLPTNWERRADKGTQKVINFCLFIYFCLYLISLFVFFIFISLPGFLSLL